MSDAVRPFEIAFEDAALEDLALRLQLTRWPEVEPVNDWSQGVPLSWLKQVHAHWRDGYDWRARETLLNRFQHQLRTNAGVLFVRAHCDWTNCKAI